MWLRTFLAIELIALAALLVWRGDGMMRELEAPVSAGGEIGVAAAFDRALDGVDDRYAYWSDELDAALSAPAGGQPDLALAASWLDAFPDIVGEDAQADAQWAQANGSSNADPGAAHASESRDGLIFASDVQRERFAGAARLYGRVYDGARDYFIGSAQGRLDVAALPGLTREDGGAAVLQGDVRDALVHGCGLRRLSGADQSGCGAIDALAPEPDPLVFLLSLYAQGARTGAFAAPEDAAVGARIAKALRLSGRMRPELAALIEAELGPADEALAGLDAAFAAADRHYADAARAEPAFSEAVADLPAASDPEGDIHAVLAHFGAIRSDTSALAAIRMGAVVGTPDDAERLARVARNGQGRTLALHHLAGAAMLDPGETDAASPLPSEVQRQGARAHILLAVPCLALGFGLLLGGGRRRRKD